jgi:hypothetical protein
MVRRRRFRLSGASGCSLLFLCLAAQTEAATGVSSLSPADETTPHQSQYVYCNVYLDYACFGIASGDSLEMSIPVDFTLYSIGLGADVKAIIYNGNNPQDDAFKPSQSKQCAVTESTGKCVYVKSNSTFDLLYQANAKASFIHLHLTGLKPSNADNVNDFLANFRSCKPVNQNVQCTNERIFKNIKL